MGIQINGNNDIISALDGSWTAEGASINTSGILTATTFKGNIVGTAATFTGPVTIGGTLTYEDVTNIDSVGIVTARAGIIDSTLTAGRVVYADTDKSLTDNAKLTFDGSQLFVTRNLSTAANDSVTGSEFRAGMFYFRSRGDSAGISGTTYANQLISSNGSNVPLEIYTQGSATGCPIVFGTNTIEKFRIHSTGVNVKGDIDLDNGGSAGVNFKRNGTLKSDIEIGSASDQLAIRARGSSGHITFHTNTSTVERLRITSAGSVGIGITNPISKISVEGTGDGTTGSSYLGDTAAAAGLFLKTHSGSSVGLALGGRTTGGQYIQAAYQNSTVVSVRDLCINPYGGGVGIGTFAPNFGGAPGADTIVFGTSQTERLRIDSNGYLSFAGDTNTYIWHPEADQIAITKGGASFPIIRFGSGGAGGTIAIGNTTANLVTNSEILSVRGYSSFKSTTNNYAAIYTHNEGNTSGTYNAHILWNAGGANRGGIGYMPNTGDVIINNHQALIFATGGTQFSGTERLHITSDGAIENTYVDEKRGIAPIFRDYVTLNNSWQNIARISGYANATMFRFVFEGQASGTFWNGYADIMVGHYRQYKCKLHNGGSFPVSVRLFGNGSGTCDLQVKSEGGNSGTLGFNIIPSTFEADNTVVFTSSGTMSDSNLEIIGVKGTVSKSYQEKADDFKVWGSIQSGSTSEPAILKTNSNGGIIYFEHYFNCVKGGSGNSHTVNQDIVTVTGIGNFHQAIWTAQFGTRLQGQSDSWTRVGMWQTAANRFNGGSNFNFQEEWITGDSAVQQYSNIHLYEVSSTEYRLRMNWPSGTYGSSFCSGKVHCSFVNDVEDRSNVTFAYGHN